MPVRMKVCSLCDQRLPITDFPLHKLSRGGRLRRCRGCQNTAVRKSQEKSKSDPRFRMLMSSRSNALSKGLEHTISVEDIPLPEVCRYLGIRIDYRRCSERGRLRSFDAPSIDRIDPTRGYVPGNIQVISDLSNRMKQDATIPQLLAFAEGVIRVHGS